MEDLARLSIKNKPVYVGVDDAEQESTVDGLEQVNRILVRSLLSFRCVLIVSPPFLCHLCIHCCLPDHAVVRRGSKKTVPAACSACPLWACYSTPVYES